MTPEEYAKYALFADGRFLAGDEMGKTIEKVIKLALAERTEQCAKICDERVSFAEDALKLFADAPTFDRNGMHVKTYSTAVRNESAFIAAQIRALNQPENKS